MYIFVVFLYCFCVLMVLVSPLFIPLILFRATKSYFARWLRLTASFIIQPIILFAYLTMLLAAFDTVVFNGPNSLYHAIAGNAANNACFSIGSWLMGGNGGAWGADLPRCNQGVCDPAMPGDCASGQCINVNPATGFGICSSPHPGAYCSQALGGQAVTIGAQQVAQTFNLAPDDTGMMGSLGRVVGASGLDWQNGVLRSMGVDQAHPSLMRVDWPMTNVDWNWLATTTGAPSVTYYILNLFIVAFMTLATGYIFLTMLDSLPFISAAISGDPTDKSFRPPGLGGLMPG